MPVLDTQSCLGQVKICRRVVRVCEEEGEYATSGNGTAKHRSKTRSLAHGILGQKSMDLDFTVRPTPDLQANATICYSLRVKVDVTHPCASAASKHGVRVTNI